MLWLTQKSLHKKKITAFILSVLLLMTIVEPLPAWAEEKPVGPVIEAITPAQVSSAGGTVIQIKGTGLSSTTAVTIGGRPVEKISTVEDTVVEVIAPYGDAGTSSKLKLVRSDDKYAEATITYRESNPRIDEIVQDYGPGPWGGDRGYH